MRICYPIKEGRRWILATEEHMNAPFLSVGSESARLTLRNFAEHVEPAVRAMTDGKLILTDARTIVYESVQALGVKLCFFVNGREQWLGDSEWMDLVLNTNCALCMEGESFERAIDVLQTELYPAFELIRDPRSKRPRGLLDAWRAAGGRTVGRNRLVAAKGDPIWARISALGHCHPPFDFGCWDYFEEVDWEQAIRLRVVERNKSIPHVRCPGCVAGN
jgi:hypothetical protein